MSLIHRKNLKTSLTLILLTASAVSTATVPYTKLPSSSREENSLTLFLYRSPGLDWSSPRRIAKTTINNSLKKRAYPIGHMTVEVRCGDLVTRSGMSQRYFDEDNRVVRKEKQGLGVLFHNFVGRYEDNTKVDKSLALMMNSGRLGVLKFKISRESCERMLEFNDVYVSQEMFKNYGMLSRPLMGEGGGCAAYAMAYPAVGGFLEPWMIDQWSRYVKVPYGAVGGPLTGKQIGAMKTYMSGPKRWAMENEAGFEMFFYDPDRIFDWAKAVYEGRAVEGNLPFVGPVRRIPVTSELLGVPMNPNAQIFGVEIDRTQALPPVERNFRTMQKDPVEPLRDTQLLKTWWEKEISIHRAFQGQRGSQTVSADAPASIEAPTSSAQLDLSDEELERLSEENQSLLEQPASL